jgi:hypothetical protein
MLLSLSSFKVEPTFDALDEDGKGGMVGAMMEDAAITLGRDAADEILDEEVEFDEADEPGNDGKGVTDAVVVVVA